MVVKDLFDPSRDIYRTIEKVITYSASQEARLKSEISEYQVTESIEAQLEQLLSKMQLAMDAGGENEVGVWVSGFYGSGKSSFTKYLGLALDEKVEVGGERFLRHLQNRLKKAQTRALLSTVASRFPAAVVLLDLASEMLAGATMEEVSTVLYYKVLQWAGFSRNLKVAALERRLQKDGRYPEFLSRIEQQLGVPWTDVQNDPLVIDSVIPEIAHELYPTLFQTRTAFTTEASEFVRFEDERVKEMIEIVRDTTGKQHIIFIVDEVGQYVASRPNLILNLDGLAKNLKNIGGGKVWIMATAQQTLTEDDPRAALNSPELYKLNARFPIQIDLESGDIKEICYLRLLGKSPEGERELESWYDRFGQPLRQHTKLHDARAYDVDFDRETFTKLYPFLPAHFDILLHLLGVLAKSTGGIGLRSAIKVIQDILIEGLDGQQPVADRPVGWLADTVTLYDALEKDIRRAKPSEHKAVGKVLLRFPHSAAHLDVAKTVAVLQILGNMPVTARNVSALLHPAVDAVSRQDEVAAAIEDLIQDSIVPFGEKDGNLVFFSEKLNDIDRERAEIPLRSIEVRKNENEALRDAWSPLPSTRLHNSFLVTAGLKVFAGAGGVPLAGEQNTIQMVVSFADPQDYEDARSRLLDESRQTSARNTIYALGRRAAETEEKAADMYRCREIAQRYRNDPDQQVKEYCASQLDRAERVRKEVQHAQRRQLSQGSFIFRGQATAVATLDVDVVEAAKKYLAGVAEQVFDRYGEAPARAETSLAEKFIRAANLNAVTSAIDPLGLVQMVSGTPQINVNHRALVSIRDYIDRTGTVDGKRLADHFTEAPFGWSQDTLRYLVAALFRAGEVKLKVSGREVAVVGQQAIDALKSNTAFKPVGVSLRDDRPSIETLARAAERMRDLSGERVIPLEDDISKAAVKYFPKLQLRYGPLAAKLEALNLPGVETVRSVTEQIAEVLLSDGSDVPKRLGAEDSSFFDALRRAAEIDRAFKEGLEATIRDLKQHCADIAGLPNAGAPGDLRAAVADEAAQAVQRLAQDNFYQYAADFRTWLDHLKARTREAAGAMADAQKASITQAGQALELLSEWAELTQEEQAQTLGRLEELAIYAPHTLAGLKQILAQEYVVRSETEALRTRVQHLAHQRQMQRRQEEKERAEREGRTKLERQVSLPLHVTSAAQLDELIARLQSLRAELAVYSEVDVTLNVTS